MSDLNQVTLSGNIGKDPEPKFFESGSVLLEFSLAVGKWSKKESQEITDWHNIKFWLTPKQMDYFGNVLVKGTKVVVSGSLDVEKWEKDGEKRSKVVIVARDVIVPRSPKGQGQSQGYQQTAGEAIPF